MAGTNIHKDLFNASVDGNNPRVIELLAAGGDPNKHLDEDGLPGVYWASLRDHQEVLDTLIEAGADLNIKGQWGETTLHRAAVNRECLVMTKLIRAGANLDLRNNDGQTALFWAVERGYKKIEISSALLQGGADPNMQDKEGDTALTLAARSMYPT